MALRTLDDGLELLIEEPAESKASGDASFPWRATFAIVVRETAGLACNANFYTQTLINSVTNQVSSTREFSATDIQASAGGTNHIPANGVLRISRNLTYTPGGTASTGRAINIQIALQVSDANGNTINATSTVRALRSERRPVPGDTE